MLELFHFLVDFQIWIYVILGVLALIYLIRVISAWRERQTTIFGLEREDAQRRLNAALAIFIFLILLIGAEFVLVTFVIPEWPMVMLTPTPAPPASEQEEMPMITRPAQDGGLVIISTPEGAVSVQGSSSVPQLSSGCIPNQLEWIQPVSGDILEGSYTLEATVNVQNMGFYDWAFSPVTDQVNWQTLSAGNLPIIESALGLWATTQFPNGDYVLRLTVYDLDNQKLPPCDVYIRILNEE